MKKVTFATLALALLLGAANAYNYRWTGTSSGSWTNPSNWNPTRITPRVSDTLIFRLGHADTVTGVPTEFVSYLAVDSLTQITLVPQPHKRILSVGGDVIVAAGSMLTLESVDDTMTLYVGIPGSLYVDGTVRLHADSLSTWNLLSLQGTKKSLHFNSGSQLVCECYGWVFGGDNGIDSTAVFHPGSKLIDRTGDIDPFIFHWATGRSKTWWQPGSRYVLQTGRYQVDLAHYSRTFADFEFDNGAGTVCRMLIPKADTFDSLIVTSGTVEGNGLMDIHCNVRVAASCSLDLGGQGNLRTCSFTGIGNQYILGDGCLIFDVTILVDKPSGDLLLERDFTVKDTVELVAGRIVTGDHVLYQDMDDPVLITNDSTYILGNYKLNVPLSSDIRHFHIGTENGKSSVSLYMIDVGTPYGTYTVSASQGVHPNMGIPANALQRYWTITTDLVPGVDFSHATVQLYYRHEDFNTNLIEEEDEATMVVARYDDDDGWIPTGYVQHFTNLPPFAGMMEFATNELGTFTAAKDSASFTGVAGPSTPLGVPATFKLSPVRPNPVRSQATIQYQLPKASKVTLEIYSITGQMVKRFDEGTKQPGYHSVTWDAAKHGAGVYFYRLKAGEYQSTRKLVVI